MKTSHWLGIIGLLILLLICTELNRTNTIAEAFWVLYSALAIFGFTVAWISLGCCGVIWVYQRASRGHFEDQVDALKRAEANWEMKAAIDGPSTRRFQGRG